MLHILINLVKSTQRLISTKFNVIVFFFTSALGGEKVSMLTHTFSHKPLSKIKLAIYKHQAGSPVYIGPNVPSGDLYA